MYSTFIPESSIAPQLYSSVFWETTYFQVISTMFISPPVFSDLFSFFYWEYFQWSNPTQTQLSYFTFTFHLHALEKEMATHSSVLA